MNILLSSDSKLDPEVLDNLSRLPDISIYLSLSQEDSQRIINEINPEIVIINEEDSGSSFANQLCLTHPEMEVYLYNASQATNHHLTSCNSKTHTHPGKLATLIPMASCIEMNNQTKTR